VEQAAAAVLLSAANSPSTTDRAAYNSPRGITVCGTAADSAPQENWMNRNGRWIFLAGLTWLLSIHNARLPAEPVPSARVIPDGPLGETIRLGQTLVEKTTTHPLTSPYVGNALNCTSCHLQNGLDPKAASFLGIATAYPAWSPREGRVITLEDRVLNCFMRSCNGVRPPLGSEPSVAIAAYITWLSSGEPIRMNPKQPKGPRAVPGLSIPAAAADIGRGRALYRRRCAECHADDGQGDEHAPPVWGERSFNEGAGLAQNGGLAAWLKVAMPPDERDLAEQEALDVAAYVNSHPRPKFVLKEHLPEASRLGAYNSQEAGP